MAFEDDDESESDHILSSTSDGSLRDDDLRPSKFLILYLNLLLLRIIFTLMAKQHVLLSPSMRQMTNVEKQSGWNGLQNRFLLQ